LKNWFVECDENVNSKVKFVNNFIFVEGIDINLIRKKKWQANIY